LHQEIEYSFYDMDYINAILQNYLKIKESAILQICLKMSKIAKIAKSDEM